MLRILLNWKFLTGAIILLSIFLASILGPMFVEEAATLPTYARFNQQPSSEYWLGTDNVGRDLFALLIYSLWPTLTIGLIAGGISTGIGTLLGLVSGYVGGAADFVIRTIADITLTIPSLIVLILVASYLETTSIEMTAIVVGLLAWAGPTRAIRAQTLSLRERGYIKVARLNRASQLEIILLDIMPNLTPYILAGLISAIAGGILASVGLQLLGIGPLLTPNIGMTLSAAFSGGAMVRGAWWWWAPPVMVLAFLFFATFIVTLALDEIANPRLREQA